MSISSKVWSLQAAFGVLLLAGSFCSCASNRYLWSQADSHYTAVKIIDWDKPPSGSDRTIRVLLVHGMNTHPFGTLKGGQPNLLDKPTYRELQKYLGQLPQTPQGLSPVIKQAINSNWSQFIQNTTTALQNPEDTGADHQFRFVYNSSHQPTGYIFTRTFKANPHGVKIKFYIANWSLGAAVQKEHQFGSWNLLQRPVPQIHLDGKFSDFDTRLNSERNGLNRTMKLNVMDWGLGDAALYLGEYKEQFQQPVRAALEMLQQESAPKPEDRVAIVTHSLGSTITLDTVATLLPAHGASLKARPVEASTASKPAGTTFYLPAGIAFYMFANQYGLLTMGTSDASQTYEALRKLNTGLQNTPLARQRGQAAMQVYAFTDPDDLLSYPLNLGGLPLISVCNVYVHNGTVDLGFIREPAEVHVNYAKNTKLLETMLYSPANPILPPKK